MILLLIKTVSTTTVVYDDTDHYWRLDTNGLTHGASTLMEGIEGMEEVVPEPIYIGDLTRQTVPDVDELGRPILDTTTYLIGQNEWIKSGPTCYWNLVSNLGAVSQNAQVNELFTDINNGLPKGKYPEYKHVNNTCSGCDEKSAPAGYIVTKRVEEATSTYARHHSRLVNGLNGSTSAINELIVGLNQIARDLENGENVSPSDFRPVADSATDVYKALIPDSDIAAPTATEQKWYPTGFGFGAAALFGIGAGLLGLRSQRRRNYWNS